MIRVQPFGLAFVLAIAVVGDGWPSVVATAAGPLQNSASEEDLKRLVVMVQSVVDEQTFNGAGIIFARRGTRLDIVTANHVVRSGPQPAERVKVQFKWIPDQWWDARVLEHKDTDLDIAVISVFGGQELDIPELAWQSISPPQTLSAGEKLRPVGFPRGVPWFIPQQRHLFHSQTQRQIQSEGELDPGNSGGALVTEGWGIVGITTQADRPYNRSSRIDRAVEKLREWKFDVALTTKVSIPVEPTVKNEPARVLKDVQPLYPADAKARGIAGTVELVCTVANDGRAKDIKVVKSVDPRLDDAAVKALEQWEFAPALKFGEPVPARMTVEMTFSLK
jgi:TonB family protein